MTSFGIEGDIRSTNASLTLWELFYLNLEVNALFMHFFIYVLIYAWDIIYLDGPLINYHFYKIRKHVVNK